MKTKSVHVLLLLFAVSIFPSCRKEKTSSRNTQLLTQESWQYDQFGIDEDLDGQIDIISDIEDCAKDDEVKFHDGGNGQFDQGDILCDPGHPQTQNFDWEFHTNETQLEYGGTVHHLLKLDESELIIYTEEENGANTVRHILTYKH